MALRGRNHKPKQNKRSYHFTRLSNVGRVFFCLIFKFYIMLKMQINRFNDNGKQTTGYGLIINSKNEVVYSFVTLELPWLNNQVQVSCIPIGEYVVQKRISEKFKKHFRVKNVPNRDLILIHQGNTKFDILGCILVGRKASFVNKDVLIDISESRFVLAELIDLMPSEFMLEIKNVNDYEVKK